MEGGEALRVAEVAMGLNAAALNLKVMGSDERCRCAACGVHSYVPRGRRSSFVCRNCGAERFEALSETSD
jgi:hypothetical protein